MSSPSPFDGPGADPEDSSHAARLPERYRDVTPLGQGAFARVYRALDEAGRELAVKVLAPAVANRADAAWAFEAEGRRLARLDHPAFPTAYETGRTPAGLPFYAMALAPGSAPLMPCHESDARRILQAVAAGLAHAHARGLVHGDIKPENVRVALDEHAPRVMVIDVGLMAPRGQRRRGVSGTLEYLAPEAFRRAPVDPKADVYALGCLAYALLTGGPPFAGSPAALLRLHQEAAPPPLANVSPDLAALVAAMLAKDPARRPSGGQVAAALGGESMGEEADLAPGAFVGRDAVLDAWGNRLLVGGSVALVGGPGLGKSRALDELAWRADAAGRTWLGVTCASDDPPGGPARALVMRALESAGAAPASPLSDWLRGEVPEAWRDLEPGAARTAAVDAAVTAFEGAAQNVGLAVGLDDDHLADDVTRAFLVAARGRAPGVAWAVARATPAGPADGEAFTLEPLTPPQLEALLVSRLGDTPPGGLLDELMAASQGVPATADDLLERWVAARALRREHGDWVLDATALATSAGADAWQPRLALLSDTARGLGAALAVAAPAGDLPGSLVADLAGQGLEAATGAFDELAAAGLVDLAGGRVRLVARSAAGALSAALDSAERANMASRLARAVVAEIEGLDGRVRAAWLALEGDDESLAVDLAGDAGRRCLALGAPDRARAMLEGAWRRMPAGVEPRARLEVALPLADACRFTDALDTAREVYLEARGLAAGLGDSGAEGTAATGLAKVLQLKGDYPGAAELLEAVVASDAPAGTRARAASVLARVLIFRGDNAGALARCAQAAELAAEIPAVLATALNLQGMLLAQLEPERQPEAVATIEAAIAISQSLQDRQGEVRALETLGNTHLAVGALPEAEAAFGRSAAIASAIALRTELLGARLNQALASADLGRVQAAEALAADAWEMAVKSGRKFPQAFARAVQGQLAWRDGRLADAVSLLEESVALASAIGNRPCEELARVYLVEALVAVGRDAAAREAAEQAAAALTDAHGEMAGRLACERAELARRAADLVGAESHLTSARAIGHQVVQHRTDQLEALLMLDLAQPERARDAARNALARARAWRSGWHEAMDLALQARADLAAGSPASALAAARAVLAAEDPNPFALAVAADVLAAGGDPAGALMLSRAADAGFKAPAADTGAARIALGAPPVDGGGAGRLDVARLADHLAAIGAATTEEAVGQAALAAALELAGADRGYWLLYDRGRLRPAVAHGIDYEAEAAGGFSRSIVERVLFSGEPLYVVDAASDETWRESASVMALQLRTVLCVPVETRTRLLGALYLDRAAPEPALGPGDVALVGAIANTAGRTVELLREKAAAEAGEARRALVLRLAEALLPGPVAPNEAMRLALGLALEAAGAERAFWLEGDPQSPAARASLDAAGRPTEFTREAVSTGVLATVRASGEGLGLVDIGAQEGWQARASVMALGLRTVWCVPAGPDAWWYLDAATIAPDPQAAVAALTELAAFAARTLPREA